MKINIPKPCAENYDNMSPTDLGKMCEVCNTEVVDFTNWKTKDIVTYIQESNKKVCGRLKPLQVSEKRKTKLTPWLKAAGIISLLSFSKPLFSQANKQKEIIVNGNVRSNLGEIINHGYVTYNYNIDTTRIDSNGNFRIKLKKSQFNNPLNIEVSALGYETQIIELKSKTNLTIVLEQPWIGEVVVEPISRIKPIKKFLEKLKPLK